MRAYQKGSIRRKSLFKKIPVAAFNTVDVRRGTHQGQPHRRICLMNGVIQLPGGDWCAFEIKLGANQIDEAAASLVKLKNDIEHEPGGIPPKILCVICGMSSAAYRREDGVYVVPVTALRE